MSMESRPPPPSPNQQGRSVAGIPETGGWVKYGYVRARAGLTSGRRLRRAPAVNKHDVLRFRSTLFTIRPQDRAAICRMADTRRLIKREICEAIMILDVYSVDRDSHMHQHVVSVSIICFLRLHILLYPLDFAILTAHACSKPGPMPLVHRSRSLPHDKG